MLGFGLGAEDPPIAFVDGGEPFAGPAFAAKFANGFLLVLVVAEGTEGPLTVLGFEAGGDRLAVGLETRPEKILFPGLAGAGAGAEAAVAVPEPTFDANPAKGLKLGLAAEALLVCSVVALLLGAACSGVLEELVVPPLLRPGVGQPDDGASFPAVSLDLMPEKVPPIRLAGSSFAGTGA